MKFKMIYFLIVSILYVGAAKAHDTAEEVIDSVLAFKELKKAQKNEWLNFKKEEQMSKLDLVQKHFNEWENFVFVASIV